MEGVTIACWPVSKLGPSTIFEQTNQDTAGLVSMLDEKIIALSPTEGMTKRMFNGWLSILRKFASAIIFHGGELAAKKAEPLTVFIVNNDPAGKGALQIAQRGACPGGMDVCVVSVVEFKPLLLPKEGGSSLRPFLSSELLVLGAKSDIEMLEMMFRELRLAFEMEPLDDLVRLVSLDVINAVFKDGTKARGKCTDGVKVLMEETDFTGRNPIKKRVIGTGEFEDIALRAMSKRRIPYGIQAHLIPKIMAAVG